MNIKLIALDMDRTTLNADGRLSEKTKKAEKKQKTQKKIGNLQKIL